MTAPYYTDEAVTLWHGDCLDVISGMADTSVDAVCTDPPYSYEFMNRSWDRHETPQAFQRWCYAWSRECLRVLKPGGHMLAFGGTRTWHRLTCGIEDAGFEIRDSITWLYGSGFPKSLDVSKAIDKAAGAERQVIGTKLGQPGYSLAPGKGRGTMNSAENGSLNDSEAECAITAPATPAAQQWSGWGTALKPSHEPIVVARKPLAGTVAANVVAHGTGALNIDGCRVGTTPAFAARRGGKSVGGLMNDTDGGAGRWPTNVVLDGDAADELDQQSGTRPAGGALTGREPSVQLFGRMDGDRPSWDGYGDTGGASRFFPVFRYEAKAPASERPKDDDGTGHPTVKPLDLMRWLVRLVTPPGGLILDPFAGSGTTGEACVIEGFRAVLIEQDEASCRRTVKRLSRPIQPTMFGDAS